MSGFWRGKRVLITGANGFLGSHLAVRLARYNANVIGIIKEKIKNTYIDIELAGGAQGRGLKILTTDIVDLKKVAGIFRRYRPDICIHVAAQPIVGIANKSPLGTFKANIEGTWNILEAARVYGTKAVVVASSDKAYGEHKKLPYTEDAALLALHPYDASKTCADILTRVYAHTYGLNTAVTRCANIYGPGDLNFSRIMPDTIRSAILNRNPVIRSDGTPLRDYIYVDDVVDAYLLLAQKLYNHQVKTAEAFNFGTGKPVSVSALVKKILQISGKPDLSPKILSKGKIRGEIDRQYLSSLKANRILGWKCRYSLDKGLKETIRWYSAHPQCLSR